LKNNKLKARTTLLYGNGSRASFTYDNLNQRLTRLQSWNANSDLMQDIEYSYDNASNITDIANTAGYSGDLAGPYDYHYTYDDIYRLGNAKGGFNSYYNGNLTFELDLSYSASGNILTKTMDATTELSGITSALLYNNSYSYSDRPHNVTSVNDVDSSGTTKKRLKSLIYRRF
jgi:hypothetical protein